MKKKLVKRETNPDKISKQINKIFESSNKENQKRAGKIVRQMEDPILKLIKIVNE